MMVEICTKCIIPDSYPGITIEDGICSFCKNQNSGTTTNNSITGLLNKVITLLITVAGAVATIGIVLSGLAYVTANGDASKISKARSALMYSAIGLVVAIFARLIVAFAVSLL